MNDGRYELSSLGKRAVRRFFAFGPGGAGYGLVFTTSGRKGAGYGDRYHHSRNCPAL